MEWNHGSGQQPATQPAHTSPARKAKESLLNIRLISVVLLFCLTVLMVALVGLIAFGDGSESQSNQVDKGKMQAVFLNGGQVYFGKIQTVGEKSIRLADIYYLRVNQQVQPDANAPQAQNNISLVKLGCELHGPQDSMVINQEQVIFWENLKDDGQVAKAVTEYKKQNPDGQKCETGQQTPADNATPAPTTPAPTTPTTPTNTNQRR